VEGRRAQRSAVDALVVGECDAGVAALDEAGAEPGLHAELTQRLLDRGARIEAHVRRDRVPALDDHDPARTIFAQDDAQTRRHLGG